MTNQEILSSLQPLRRRRRSRQLLGACVFILVLIGIFSIFSSIFNLVGILLDDSEERLAYETRLTNLVALDPIPFDSLDQANQNTLLHAAIWASIDNEHNTYERDENGMMYLPTLDLEVSLASLYGPDYKVEYATFEDHGLTFTYVPEKQAFLLPITSVITDYYPVVTKIQNESGGIQRVTVGYVSPYSASDFSSDATLTPIKYQDYLFKKVNSEYYLTAIVESETQLETADSSSMQSSLQTPNEASLQKNITDMVDSNVSIVSDSAVGAQ